MSIPDRRLRTLAIAAASLLVCQFAAAQGLGPSVLDAPMTAPYLPAAGPSGSPSLEMLPPPGLHQEGAPPPGGLVFDGPVACQPCEPGWCAATSCEGLFYRIGGKARGYYVNDQRIEFTGQEASFAAEGVVDGGVRQRLGVWELGMDAEIFLNQPYDRNLLVDTEIRRSFEANFDIEPVQISQLVLGARRNDLYVALGRFVTPFGRFYYPLYRNNFDDSPFIRSEAILYRETGLLLQWDPAWWVFTAALTNGGPEQDTNSSKALIARVGIDQSWFAVGASIKVQDGIGSEGQKTFNEHVGIDAMVRRGPWALSGEAIYDQYGLRRPGTNPNDITWGRSLYFRDLNNGLHEPITGVGWYCNLGYEGPYWTLVLNYGEFYPEEIGDLRHDQEIRRGMVKASRHWTRYFETYGAVLIENERIDNLDTHPRKGTYLLCGCQFSL